MIETNRPPAGARPGTLVIPEGSPPPRIYVFEYDAEQLIERSVESPEELAAFAGNERVTWIDVQGLGDEATLRRIAEIFELHPLALEDAVNIPQRAKSEHYEEHQLIIARAPLEDSGDLVFPQVCLIAGSNYLITFQERYFGFFDAIRERVRAGNATIRGNGVDYLAYTLIDALVDTYYPVIEAISSQIDWLEDQVLEEPEPEDLGRLHRARRELAGMRRVAVPQREMLGDLVRSPSPFIGEVARAYLRDADEHMGQIVGRIDFYREVAVGLMDLHLSTMGHRQNEIMTVLTLMASIFIPLTFIAGIYGMNFENMPELQSRSGYFIVLFVMIVLAGALVGYFRHRGWLGRARRRTSQPPRADR